MPDRDRAPVGKDSDEESRGVVDPVVLVGGLGLIAGIAVALRLGGVPFQLAQQVTAALLVLLALAVVLRSPQNGLLLLFLVPALSNGEDFQPYFFLLEVLVYLTVIAGVAERLARRALRVPYAGMVGLFVLCTVISVPLNLKELWLEVRISEWRELVEGLRRSDPWSNFAYPRAVLNVASGIALYVLAASYAWSRALLVRLAVAATVLYVAVTLVGLFWLAIFPPQIFLTIHLHGWATGPFSGLGFNTSYFAQYALVYLPLAVLVLAERGPAWTRALAAGAVLVSGYTILATYQRAAYVVLVVEVVLLAVAATLWTREREERPRLATLAITGGLVAVTVAILALTPVGAGAYERMLHLWLAGDSYREHVLTMAWRMFLDHPVLGVGTGGYAQRFAFHSPRAREFHWGSLSSHNLYLQLLAEQGVAGLLSFLGLLVVTLAPAVGSAPGRTEAGTVRRFLLVSLGAWLTYGLFQHTLLMRSMQIYFWIALGLVVALTPRPRPPRRAARAVLALGLLLVLAVGVVRAYGSATRSITPGAAVGVFDWQADVRWTRSRAVLVVPVEGRVLQLWLACPFAPVVGRPQTVELSIDGALVRRITLAGPDWQMVELPVDRPRGSTIELAIGAGYTVVPAEIGVNADQRRLGVLMRSVGWKDS
jgi:O-antigen ligase